MWLMLQQDKPDDYVIATGVSHSVRDLCDLAFSEVGLDYRDHVVEDRSLYRPAEVDHLLGDATKGRSQLGWQPEVDFATLIKMMVAADVERLRAGHRAAQPADAPPVKRL
jgi:GDPmannose 4,6-dehydratase